jgi:hypothetical protein
MKQSDLGKSLDPIVQVVLMRLRSEVEEAGNLTERYTNHITTVAEAALRNTHLLKVGL